VRKGYKAGYAAAWCLLACAMVPAISHAEIFMCKDANGRTISSDRPIPECASRSVDELGRNGQIKRVIAAPLTPEEKRQKQLEEEKRKAEAAAAAEQKNNDRAILERYGNERDIENARQRAIANIQEQIKRSTVAIADADKQLTQASLEAAPYLNKQRKVPVDLQNRIDQLQRIIKEETDANLEHRVEIDRTNAKFDQTLKRFRELTGVAAK
jgi:hypothetical protein